MKQKILVVDDDHKLCKLIAKYGTKEGYDVTCVHNTMDALTCIEREYFDIITLDIEIGEESGLNSIVQIKKKYDGPILFLSCVIESDVILKGLQLGADDYLNKPFSFVELFNRIDRNIEKTSRYRLVKLFNYTIDEIRNIVIVNGSRIELSENAIKILLILLRNPDQIITREELYGQIWGASYEKNTTRIIDAHISNMRKKIDDPRIKSVRGKGYMFQSEDNVGQIDEKE